MTELLLPPPPPPTIGDELADADPLAHPAVQEFVRGPRAQRVWALAEAIATLSTWRTSDLTLLHRRVELDPRPPRVPREYETTPFRGEDPHRRALTLCLYRLGVLGTDYVRGWLHAVRWAHWHPCDRQRAFALRAIREARERRSVAS